MECCFLLSTFFTMNRFFFVLLIAFILTGCNKKTEEAAVDSAAVPAEVQTLGISMPTPEMLTALGPENDIPIRHLQPDAILALVGKPKQFLVSPISIGNEPLISEYMMQGMQLYRFDLKKVERFVQTSGLPVTAAINVPNPQDPNALPQQQIIPIARRTTVVTFDAPIEKAAFFTTVLNIDPAALETRKRTDGKIEYYDLTPADIIIPQRLAVGLIDERNVVFVEGVEADIKAIFSDTIPKNAVLDRLKHTPLDADDLTIITSLEGQNISPQMLEMMMGQLGQAGFIPQNLVSVITQNLRSLSISLKISAAVGQPVISITAEGRDEKSGEAIAEAIRGLIIGGQTTMIAMSDEAKKTLPIPADFALSLLNAMSVEVNAAQVYTVLNNFETLMTTVKDAIHNQQTLVQERQMQQRRAEQFMMISELWRTYYDEHKKFPTDITDAEGKPLLSWRVALLPKLGLEDLYKQFKLDEPWDSETNKALLTSMPFIYHPMVPEVTPPKTIVRFFDSEGTPLANKDLKPEDIKIPATTLLFVAVTPQYAVEWTKPDSLALDMNKISEITGDTLFGIMFDGQICYTPLLPNTHADYEKQRKNIEAMIKGLPLQTTPPQGVPTPAPVPQQ
jgi:hypothetical protein